MQRRRITLYRDDSTTQVVYDNVKHWFWTANNTVLTIAQYDDEDGPAHHYINWPRERFCWFKETAMPSPTKDKPKCNEIISESFIFDWWNQNWCLR